MANHKSAAKRARQTKVKTLRNKRRKSEVRTAVKRLRTALESGERELATTLLSSAQKLLNKLGSAGIMKKTTAARLTSRLTQQFNKLS